MTKNPEATDAVMTQIAAHTLGPPQVPPVDPIAADKEFDKRRAGRVKIAA